MESQKTKVRKNIRNSSIDTLMAKLATSVLSSEAKAVIPAEFSDITENDMHIIEEVGIGEPRKSSEIAKRLGVTAGTLTINLNNLEKKGYVIRKRSSHDKRVVYILLTDRGKKAFHHQRGVHKKMLKAAIKGFSEMELGILYSCLEKLDHFFNPN